MALYRTERRLSWNHNLRIGHWYAPWSQTQADTGADYFSRTLRWLRHTHPKATVAADSHALPDVNSGWPQERFGLQSTDSSEVSTASGSASVEAQDTAAPEAQQMPHAGDLLIIEWPQPHSAPLPPEQEKTGHTADGKDLQALPPLWINGLERALRRNWQDNPQSEIIFIGGATDICRQGIALAAHYGITVLDPMALLQPDSASAADHREVLLSSAENGAPRTLTPQGQEIWAGMLIGLLREQVRFGPTPDPVSLPNGLWCSGG